MLVVSPHLDDAVLSAGQLIAGRPDCIIATVFAGTPDLTAETTWDRNCGWLTSDVAMDGRKAEDTAAANLLRATAVRFDFLDQQYREVGLSNHTTATEEQIAGTILEIARPLVEILGRVTIAGPMGLHHPDHHLTRRAVERAARALGPKVELWCYEDLPARVLWPDDVPDALAWWRGMGWDPVLGFAGTGDPVIKEAAVRCYRSQLWCPEFGGDQLHNVLVPERMHRMWPCA